MFRTADIVLLTKMDLAPVMDDFDTQRAEDAVRNLANAAPVVALSARQAMTLVTWTAWLRGEVTTIRAGHDRRSGTREANHGHHRPAMA
jgi:hydrogenase nickel incorporation protein HypB